LKGRWANAWPWHLRFRGAERVGAFSPTALIRRDDEETCRHLVFRELVHGVDRVAVLVWHRIDRQQFGSAVGLGSRLQRSPE